MLAINILSILLAGLLGYIIGRIGDYYINFWIKDPWWIPHHWIYGLALMIVSLFIFPDYWKLIFSFGVGHFVSDLKDFLELKIFGSDNKDKVTRRFWHVD